MANPVGFSPTSLIAPDLQTQLLANQRKQQIAQMLREQAITPEQTQEVSGRVVPYGIGQGLTKLAQALMARRGQKKADEQMADINQQYAQRYAAALMKTIPGTAENATAGGELNADGTNPGTVGPTLQNAAKLNPAVNNIADAAVAAGMTGNQQLANALTGKAWDWQAPTDTVKTYTQLGVPLDLARAATERELGSKGLSNTAQLIQELNAAPQGEQDPYAIALGLKPNAEQNLQNSQRNREISNQERQTYFETGMGPGQSPVPTASGMTPKQQSEITAERVKSKPQDVLAYNNLTTDTQTAIKAIDSLLQFKEGKPFATEGLNRITGPIFGRTPNYTSDAVNAQANLNTLKNKLKVQTLNMMREMSKTGGAVGNVTEKEWPILESQLGSLETAQSTDQFVQRLMDIRDTLQRVNDAAYGKFKNTYGEEPAVTPVSSGWKVIR